MGMFDEILCRHTLPVVGLDDSLFQTKSLAETMDLYEIRADGTLWHETYDTEDQSDPHAEGIKAIIGCRTRVNKQWQQMEKFTGEIQFYRAIGENTETTRCGWLEFSAYFANGLLQQINLLEHRPCES